MRVKSLAFIGAVVFAVLLNACGGSAQVDEKAVSNSTVAEEIYINNCGNPASAKQVSQRSQSVAVQGGVGLGFDIKELAKGSVEAKYTSTSGVMKSQEVTAAPDTNMKFILLWTEQVSEGTVTVTGYSGQATYRVSTPMSVQQASAVDMGCIIPTSIPTSIPTTPSLNPKSIYKSRVDFFVDKDYEEYIKSVIQPNMRVRAITDYESVKKGMVGTFFSQDYIGTVCWIVWDERLNADLNSYLIPVGLSSDKFPYAYSVPCYQIEIIQ